MKKISIIHLVIAAFFGILLTFTTSSPVFAENGNNSTTGSGDILFEGRTDCQPVILGMVPWDCDVLITNDQNTLKTGIWTAATNIASDITILAAYLALGFVVYGGYQYTLSGDEPAKAASGKKTLTRAFIGLAITMSSTVIMSSIRSVLIGQNGSLVDCVTESCVSPDTLFINTLHWFVSMAGIASAVFIVYGGITYSSSAGSAEKTKKAKSMILNALIGLAIVALAELILAYVSSTIRSANDSALLPQTEAPSIARSTSPKTYTAHTGRNHNA